MTTPVHTLTLEEFLLARIAEDETAARAVGVKHWRTIHDYAAPGDPGVAGADSPTAEDAWGVCRTAAHVDAAHIARWDPARVLADCEAKRRILEMRRMDTVKGTTVVAPQILRLLALPYADHPDYRPEWRP